VVFGYRNSKDGKGVGSLLLGLHDEDATMHYVGHTSSFKAAEKRELLEKLRPLINAENSPMGRMPGGPSRWTGTRDLSWVSVEPVLVCEVSFDHMQGDRFRHGTTFQRWRPDKDPKDCNFEQVAPPRPFSLEEIRKLS
jgi:ATP-dependent DNA ligase